ncbi:hypothetical protein GCM10009098_08700 [Rheinheimera aquimaris]|uniref:Uncharacterized protein n=1 Tax=Rheinheimera aquimaris TaxID=412437 RepID=A0ABP3NF95_9GAMM|nr:hypothetical protein [Rheinheimera aquimaris]MCB5211958.1 hypothetical protein [Rheinheimera aquimaris]
MSVLRKIGLISAVVCSGFLHANTAVDFSAEQNAPCWKMIEQKSTGHCKLYFHRAAPQPAFAPREEISRAFSRYFSARTEFPTSFQQMEFALQFFNYSLDKYPVRESLNFIRSKDGTAQLSMTILTSATGGYSFVLADTDAHLRLVVDALQRSAARPATHYQRSIAKLFAE